MKNAKNKPKRAKISRTKSSKKTGAGNKDTDKTKKLNKILLTIIFITFIVIAILNINQLLQLQSSKSEKSEAKEHSNVVIHNNLQDEETSSEQSLVTKDPNIKQEETEEPPPVVADDEKSDQANLTLTVYFVKILEDGQISIQSRPRVVPKSLAILTQTMKELLKGPTEKEIALGLAHFIPTGSKLNKVTLNSGVAHLDFNEAFQLNEYGSAGILAQLYQIVFTCTELPSIKAVKITINNAIVKYLGGEGNIEIDFPLTRAYLDSL